MNGALVLVRVSSEEEGGWRMLGTGTNGRNRRDQRTRGKRDQTSVEPNVANHMA